LLRSHQKANYGLFNLAVLNKFADNSEVPALAYYYFAFADLC
jgi:hypothetical protein